MAKNTDLTTAKKRKKDEFYTQLTDIEKEVRHYKGQFVGKTVLCNCDDPRISGFFKFFSEKFEELGLKKLIATCYCNTERDLFSLNADDHGICQVYEGDKRTVYEQQKGVCPCCLESFSFEEMEGDHIKPWSKGGKTRIENLQMLCRECNARKSDKF